MSEPVIVERLIGGMAGRKVEWNEYAEIRKVGW